MQRENDTWRWRWRLGDVATANKGPGLQELGEVRKDAPLKPTEIAWLYQHLQFGLTHSRTVGEYISTVANPLGWHTFLGHTRKVA